MQQTQFTQSNVLPQLATKPYRAPPSYIKGAIYWYQYGFNVIPIEPNTKRTAVKWDPWLANLSKQSITAYWSQNPAYELGFIVGDDLIVFDADSPESIAALVEIEKAFDITPNLIIKTTKGVHHYFKRSKGTVAKSDSHSTVLYPNRIDVKTGRALVILYPSVGKSIVLNEAENANDLTEVGQNFIDAIVRHNGRSKPKQISLASTVINKTPNTGNGFLGLKALLKYIGPDLGYDDWLHVLMVIFNHTKGTEYGLEIAKDWSSKWDDYEDDNETIEKWHSFNLDHPSPVRIGSLIWMVDNGHSIFLAAEEPFEIINYVTVGGAQ